MLWKWSCKGSKPVRCDYCSGRGKVRTNQGFFTVQQTCPQCSGYGEIIGTPCNKCSGNGKVQSSENVDVKIPKGVDDGTRSDSLEKVKRDQKEDQAGIFICSFPLIIITFLKDQMKIYTMNYLSLFLMLHLVLRLKFHR